MRCTTVLQRGCSILSDPAMAHLKLSDVSRAWGVKLTRAWKDETAGTMLLQLGLPDDAINLFGGMRGIYLNVTLGAGSETAPPRQEQVVSISVSWTGKTATRLAEASWLSMAPAVPTPKVGALSRATLVSRTGLGLCFSGLHCTNVMFWGVTLWRPRLARGRATGGWTCWATRSTRSRRPTTAPGITCHTPSRP